MRAGQLRERITIESFAEGVAASGTPSGGWSEFCSVRASVVTAEGKEGYEADQNTARLTHEVLIRWRSGVSSEMRVVWGSRILDIHGVVEDPMRTQMRLKCEERIEHE